jgi:CBS domain-containing protein
MKLKEIMTKQVETIAPDTPIQEAANRMRSLDVGFLPVSTGVNRVPSSAYGLAFCRAPL